jgi:hypothetical protein
VEEIQRKAMKGQSRSSCATPFVPFVLEVADNVIYPIPTADHALIGSKLIGIADDDGTIDLVSCRHIGRLRTKLEAA